MSREVGATRPGHRDTSWEWMSWSRWLTPGGSPDEIDSPVSTVPPLRLWTLQGWKRPDLVRRKRVPRLLHEVLHSRQALRMLRKLSLLEAA